MTKIVGAGQLFRDHKVSIRKKFAEFAARREAALQIRAVNDAQPEAAGRHSVTFHRNVLVKSNLQA